VIEVIAKEIKQRKESIEAYTQGNSLDLVANEKAEMEFLQQYKPAQMSHDEIVALVQQVLQEVGAKGPGDKGKVEGREVRTFRAHHMSPEDGALQLRVRTDGTTLAFTGDTGWTDEVVSLADGADLLVSECTDLHPVTEGHIAWDQLEPRLKELRARRIVLTHLGPEMCSRRKTIRAPRVRLAEDGMTLRVSRPAKRA